MNLDEYVESVRHGVRDAAALADEQSREVATKLGNALDSATRLALIRALSDAAGEISADLAPASVELRMAGPEPQFVVSAPTVDDTEPTMLLPETEEPAEDEEESAGVRDFDEPQSRITLRLPQSVKEKVDKVADTEGISTNAWLVRAVTRALSGPGGGSGGRRDPWATGGVDRDALPPVPPVTPNFPFSPGFPPPLAPRSRNRDRKRGPGGNSMRGWVR